MNPTRFRSSYNPTRFRSRLQATYDIIHSLSHSRNAPLKTMLSEPALHSAQTNTYPLLLSSVLWVYMVSMLALFANFFVRSYSSKGSSKDGKKEKKAQ